MARPFKYMAEIEEFKSKGFVRYLDNPNVLRRLRIQYTEYFRTFKCGMQGVGSCRPSKLSLIDIFGYRLCYYYDIRRKEDFVKFLVDEFYKKNPTADIGMRTLFTGLLHSHGLHWEGCCCNEKENRFNKIK